MEIWEYETIKIGNSKIVNVINKISIFTMAFIVSTIIVSTLSMQQVSTVQAESLTINNLITKDSMDIKSNKTMQRALMVANNNLPTNIKQQLYRENYTIKLQKDLIHFANDKVEWAQGVNNSYKREITVADYQLPKNSKAKDEILTENNSFTLLHEIGHTVEKQYISLTDGTYRILSENTSFVKAFDTEKYQMFNPDNFKDCNDDYLRYFRLYASEYFAECFAFYYNSKESKALLKTHAPQTYQFIKNYVDK